MKMLLHIFIFSVMLISPAVSNGGIIFEDNFDSHPDWFPQTEEEGCYTASCKSTVPGQWNYYRNDELWHPNTDGSGFHPTIQISNENFRGSSGKGYTQWNESNNGRAGDGWGADGDLSKDLGKDYSEIYVQVKVKFQPGFQWYFDQNNNAMIKMVRFQHWDRVGTPYQYFTSGNNSPVYVFDSVNSLWGFRHQHAFRCDPQSTNYYCSPSYDGNYTFSGNPTFNNSLGDGNWHTLEFHGKMNTSPGVRDGVIEFWVDGKLEYNRSDIAWMGTGSPGNLGWNIVGIGGNAFNSYAPASDRKEQWYAIDDLVISTSYVSPNYVIGGTPPLDTLPPAPPQQLR